MVGYYNHLFYSEERIRRSIRFQFLAVHNPDNINFPPNFAPTGELEKRVVYLIKKTKARNSNWRILMLVKNKEYSNRMGVLHIPFRIFDSHPEMVKEIMSHLIVVRAELQDFSNAVEYHAYSKKFEELKFKKEEPVAVPIYQVELKLEEGKITEYQIVKK